ncbi:glycosyltransferase family 4 protein [Endozoicomonas lisbonensis]
MDSPDIAIFLDSRQQGGIETHALHLARGLKKFGYSPSILFYCRYNADHPIEPLLHHHQIPFEYLDGKINSAGLWCRRHSPLLIHTHGYKANIIGRLAAKLTDTPIVSTFHNGDRGSGLIRLYHWFDELTSRLSHNIAVSPEIALRLPEPVKLMNNFIEAPRWSATTGQEVAFVGRLSHEKGPDLFLQLAKHLPDLHFTVYGSGNLHETLAASKAPNVKFAGQVTSMEPHWQQVGLLCITSREEGLPLVALEAMAHGIPVLSFAVGALPELIEAGSNGWIISEGNIKQMSKQIRHWQCLSDEDKKKLAQTCIETIRKNYSYDAVIPELLTLYRHAVNKAGYIWPEMPVQEQAQELLQELPREQ